MIQDSLQEHIVFLDTLLITSNSLTRCQRKLPLSHGWRIGNDYVMYRILLFKVSRKSYVRSMSLESYLGTIFFVGFHKPIISEKS